MLEKLLGLRSFWYHSEPFGSLSSHYSCFFTGSRSSFNDLTCCPCLFKMLGFDCSCINLPFLAIWSPYSSWYSGTCKNWYLSLPSSTMGYPCDVTWGYSITCLAFWKSNDAILSTNVIFFKGPTTRIGIYFLFNICFFRHCANMFLLCVGPIPGAWLLVCFNTPSFRLSFTHLLITLCICFNIPQTTIPHLSQC